MPPDIEPQLCLVLSSIFPGTAIHSDIIETKRLLPLILFTGSSVSNYSTNKIKNVKSKLIKNKHTFKNKKKANNLILKFK